MLNHTEDFSRIQSAPLLFSDVSNPVFLGDAYKGESAFLICSGPSAQRFDYDSLNRPGVLTMGVNNSPKLFRPNLWACVDRPASFLQSIWLDGRIMKFVPTGQANDFIFDAKAWGLSSTRVKQCPNVCYYMRNLEFDPGAFLFDDTINWGCEKERGIRSVMLVALRLLFYLGFRNVFLIGADFDMDIESPYAFAEEKSAKGVAGNNNLYKHLSKMFEELVPHFNEFGFNVFNLNRDSKLTAFPYLDSIEAISMATKRMPEDLRDEVTLGMYRHKNGSDMKPKLWAKVGDTGEPRAAIESIRSGLVVDRESETLSIGICLLVYQYQLRVQYLLSSIIEQRNRVNCRSIDIRVRMSVLRNDPFRPLTERIFEIYSPLLNLEVVEFDDFQAGERRFVRDNDIAACNVDWILFTDADIVFHPEFFSRIAEDITEFKNTGELITVPRYDVDVMDAGDLVVGQIDPSNPVENAFKKCWEKQGGLWNGGAAPGAGYFQLVERNWLLQNGINYSKGAADRGYFENRRHKNFSDVTFRKKLEGVKVFRADAEVGENGWPPIVHLDHRRWSGDEGPGLL